MGEPIDSEKGKQILAHAMSKDYCVLEFDSKEHTTQIMDITDHHRQLEQMVDDQ